MTRRAAVLFTFMFALLPLASIASPDALTPYRAFVRSPAATALLADARAAMRGHFDSSAGADSTADSLAWPGPPAGVYVSLVDGRATRACVGSPVPVAGSLRETVRALAVQALQADRRRAPLRAEELDRLRIVLSFTTAGEPVADPMSVRLAREGLLVSSARGSVAFLPGEVRTVSYALWEARRMGVLGDTREATFARLDVVTLSESANVSPRTSRDIDEP